MSDTFGPDQNISLSPEPELGVRFFRGIARIGPATAALLLLVAALGCSASAGLAGGPGGEGPDVSSGPNGDRDECGNGMDDDGDGAIDEGCFCAPGESQSCFNGDYPNRAVGACRDGVQLCDAMGSIEFGTWGSCDGDTLPAEEICDGAIDDDCDGAIDEDCPCTAGESRGCGLEFLTEPCTGGEQRCREDGTWTGCEGAIGPSADICDDGIDNDCDGEINEGCGCVPTPEICSDGVDNDCDGETDEPACGRGSGADGGGPTGDAGVPEDGAVDPLCPVPHTGIVDIAGDYWRFCALHRDGRVFCWGDNQFGALGQGDMALEGSSTPLLVTEAVIVTPGVSTLSVGGDHRACVLKASGVECWGRQPGGIRHSDGTYDGVAWGVFAPSQAAGVTGVAELAVGLDHTLMRKTDGTLWGWGYDGAGSLGDGASLDGALTATRALTIDDAVTVDARNRTVCAIRADGSVWCWGEGEEGQTGPPVGDGDREAPHRIAGIDDAEQVTVGKYHACALRATGTVECWGMDGMRGDGLPFRGDAYFTSAPAPVPDMTDVQFLESGSSTTCVIRSGGELWCWGGSPGSTLFETSPVRIGGLEPLVDVAIGSLTGTVPRSQPWGSMCALDNCGRVLCWGRNGFGQNGDGTDSASLTPVEVIGLP